MKKMFALLMVLLPLTAFAGGGGGGDYYGEDEDTPIPMAAPVLLATCAGQDAKGVETRVRFYQKQVGPVDYESTIQVSNKQRQTYLSLFRKFTMWSDGVETKETLKYDFFRRHDYRKGVSAKNSPLEYYKDDGNNLVVEIGVSLTAEIDLDGGGGFLKAVDDDEIDRDGDGKKRSVIADLKLDRCELEY